MCFPPPAGPTRDGRSGPRGPVSPRAGHDWCIAPAARVLVLADTHVRSDLSRVPPSVWRAAHDADVALHAGDVVSTEMLDALRRHVPVHAVLGNNDGALRGLLPERLDIEVGGVTIGMVHDAGPRSGRERRLHRWFPGAALVVFGHSHEPVDIEGIEGQRLFNPGSALQRRRQPHRTMGWLALAGGRIVRHAIVAVDSRSQIGAGAR